MRVSVRTGPPPRPTSTARRRRFSPPLPALGESCDDRLVDPGAPSPPRRRGRSGGGPRPRGPRRARSPPASNVLTASADPGSSARVADRDAPLGRVAARLHVARYRARLRAPRAGSAGRRAGGAAARHRATHRRRSPPAAAVEAGLGGRRASASAAANPLLGSRIEASRARCHGSWRLESPRVALEQQSRARPSPRSGRGSLSPSARLEPVGEPLAPRRRA